MNDEDINLTGIRKEKSDVLYDIRFELILKKIGGYVFISKDDLKNIIHESYKDKTLEVKEAIDDVFKEYFTVDINENVNGVSDLLNKNDTIPIDSAISKTSAYGDGEQKGIAITKYLPGFAPTKDTEDKAA